MATTRPFVAGDSPAVVLDDGVLEATNIRRDAVLEGSTRGDVVLSPLRDETQSERRVTAIGDSVFTRHARAFRELSE